MSKPKFMMDEDDGYAEAYPGTFEGTAFAAIDSDDDEIDYNKMDTRQNLKRHEFESDEAWAEHQSTREAIPKEAFQFGVKRKDGRKKKAFAEKKLKKELRAIEEIVEKKEGGKKLLYGGEGKRQRENDYASRGNRTQAASTANPNSYEARFDCISSFIMTISHLCP